jgi:hypothetical protein
MIGMRAVAEVQPKHVGSGVEERLDLRFGGARWTQSGDDLGVTAASHV